MSKFSIEAGAHYHSVPPISTLPWSGQRFMERRVTFDASCQYDFPAHNSEDVNKLFGLSFGFGGVHHNSARFGWRWSKADQCVELLACCYVNGQRNWDKDFRFPVVAQIKVGQPVTCVIRCLSTSEYGFYVTGLGTTKVARSPRLPHFGLTHGLYFGGIMAAPHEMTVRIDRM